MTLEPGRDAWVYRDERAGVLRELRGDGPYAHPALADDMERALAEDALGAP